MFPECVSPPLHFMTQPRILGRIRGVGKSGSEALIVFELEGE